MYAKLGLAVAIKTHADRITSQRRLRAQRERLCVRAKKRHSMDSLEPFGERYR